MGNRLNITLTVNLSSETPEDLLNDLKLAESDENSRFGFMNNKYNYCAGNQTFKLSTYKDSDRTLYSERYDDTYWLEIHTSFKNYNKEFEDFWNVIKPYIIPHNGSHQPVGHFWDDTKMGLIMLDGLLTINHNNPEVLKIPLNTSLPERSYSREELDKFCAAFRAKVIETGIEGKTEFRHDERIIVQLSNGFPMIYIPSTLEEEYLKSLEKELTE